MKLRRRLVKLIATAGLLGPAGISGLIRDALAKGDSPVAPGLHKIAGDVRVNGKSAVAGTVIKPGDTVTTGAGSEAIYVIGTDAFLQRDKSSIRFDGDGTQQLMRVLTGKILSVFGKSERTITITTSTATAGIRGTGCYSEDSPAIVGAGETAAEAASRSKTYFCLCYGTVELIPVAAPNEKQTYTTNHHDKPMIISNDMKMPTMMAPADVINHTDAELTMLESLVGRWPPFYAKSTKRY